MKNGESAKKNEYILVLDDHYIRPQRAWDEIKVVQKVNQTVYIYGTCGCGKTSLVMDILPRRKCRYYSAAETEAAQIEIPEKSPENHGLTIIIDDCHMITDEDERNQYYLLLENLIKRKDIWVIMISRAPIPRWLKPLYVTYSFSVIDEGKLRLTKEEVEQYFKTWGRTLCVDTVEDLEEKDVTHALSLKLIALRLREVKEDIEDYHERSQVEHHACDLAFRDMCDYVEHSVFGQWDVELQEFLMDISIVERFSKHLAQQITKKADVARLIQKAMETDYVLVEEVLNGESVYQMIPTMRDTMLRELENKTSMQHIKNLYFSAGAGYELEEDVINALLMYEKCGADDCISRLLVENSRKNPATGHYYELREYYLNLPEETVRSSAELMTGMCMLQSILMNIEESERWYEELVRYEKRQIGTLKREARARINYLDISLVHRGSSDAIEVIKKAYQETKTQRLNLPEFSLTNNQPSIINGGKDFSEWSKYGKDMEKIIGQEVLLLLKRTGKGMIEALMAEIMLERGEDSYEVSTLANKARMLAENSGSLDITFVAIGVLAKLAMMTNHTEDAFDIIDNFRNRVHNAPQLVRGIDSFKIRLMLRQGVTNEVRNWLQKQAPNEEDGFCTLDRFHYSTKVRVYIIQGKFQKASNVLQELIHYAELMKRPYIMIESLLLMAIVKYRTKDSQWKEFLQKSISLAEEYHFTRVLSREGGVLKELLKSAEFEWKDPSFKKAVYDECWHLAEIYPAYLGEKKDSEFVLSEKALVILKMQAEGLTAAQIGDQLGLSVAGIKYYNQETYKKLGVNSKAAAISEARNRKLI